MKRQSRFQGSSSFIPLKSWELGSEKSSGCHAFIVLQMKESIMKRLNSFKTGPAIFFLSFSQHVSDILINSRWTVLVSKVNSACSSCLSGCQVFTQYWTTFAPARKSHQKGLEFTHKNGDFGPISLTERCCASPIS